ncbi:diguanylate cyclase [Geminicoccaceae bacterium 1502E]|nr:diguanylate cyclase [Geminicoccaceae bacterium 1502E]
MLGSAAASLVRGVIDELEPPCFVIEQDEGGEPRFLAANAAFADTQDLTAVELAARSPAETMKGAAAGRLAAACRACARTGEIRLLSAEEEQKAVLLVPLRRPAGRPARLLGLLLPELAGLSRTATEHGPLLDLLPEPCLLADPAGRLLWLNGAARQLLQLDRRATPALADLLPGLASPLQQLLRHPVTARRADGVCVPVELAVMPAPAGGWLVTLRDLAPDVAARAEIARLQEQNELQAHELAMILDAQSEFVARFLPDTTLLYVNAAAERLLGYGKDHLLGQPFLSFVLPEERGPLLERLAALCPGEPANRGEHRALAADGRTLWLEWTNRAIFDHANRLVEFQVVGRDVTARRRAQRKLEESERRYRQILRDLPDAFLVLQDGRCVLANPAAGRLFRCAESALVGLPADRLVAEQDVPHLDALLLTLLGGREQRLHVELRTRAFDGRLIDTEIMATCCELDGRRSVQMTARDVTARRAEQATVAHLAMHDPLTGLPNRLLFQDELRRACARAERERRRAALLCLDLDGFKQVNDEHGHAMGDQVLVEIGRRLAALVRKGDLPARLGGDEFAIVVATLAETRQVERLAQRLIEALAEPVRAGEHQFSLGVSIGIGVFPDHGATGEELLERADDALYAAKRAGKGSWRLAGAAAAKSAGGS